jgi:hypothetical protein
MTRWRVWDADRLGGSDDVGTLREECERHLACRVELSVRQHASLSFVQVQKEGWKAMKARAHSGMSITGCLCTGCLLLDVYAYQQGFLETENV